MNNKMNTMLKFLDFNYGFFFLFATEMMDLYYLYVIQIVTTVALYASYWHLYMYRSENFL